MENLPLVIDHHRVMFKCSAGVNSDLGNGSVVYVRSTFSSSLRRPLILALAYPSTYFSHLYDVYVGGVGYLASENFSLLSLESHLFTTTRVFTV